MSKEDMLRLLKNALCSFTFTTKCETEIIDSVLGTGKEKAFIKLLLSRKKQIAALSRIELFSLTEFEVLQQSEGLCAMHLSSKNFNYRILFKFLNDKQILLLMFEEKQGKRVSEYSKYVAPANERYKEFLTEDKNYE